MYLRDCICSTVHTHAHVLVNPGPPRGGNPVPAGGGYPGTPAGGNPAPPAGGKPACGG